MSCKHTPSFDLLAHIGPSGSPRVSPVPRVVHNPGLPRSFGVSDPKKSPVPTCTSPLMTVVTAPAFLPLFPAAVLGNEQLARTPRKPVPVGE